jgi:hypothetical protein
MVLLWQLCRDTLSFKDTSFFPFYSVATPSIPPPPNHSKEGGKRKREIKRNKGGGLKYVE